MKEVVVEDYLRAEVKRTGGEIRKQVWPGHKGSPDDFCWWYLRADETILIKPRFAWVECKKPKGGTIMAHQTREITKMRRAGLPVYIIKTKAEVDAFILEMTT